MRLLPLDSRITIQDLMQKGDCSSATVSRLFARYLDTSPTHWIRRQRMHRAAELLITTPLPMHEIGRQVGIDDPYYFSRLFKKHHGMNARTFRRLHSLV